MATTVTAASAPAADPARSLPRCRDGSNPPSAFQLKDHPERLTASASTSRGLSHKEGDGGQLEHGRSRRVAAGRHVPRESHGQSERSGPLPTTTDSNASLAQNAGLSQSQSQTDSSSPGLFRRITTKLRSRQPTITPTHSTSRQESAQAQKQRREAALRERGLLPPLPVKDQRDLSEQEAEQDRRLTVVKPTPDRTTDAARNGGGKSAAQLIREEYEARERAELEARSNALTADSSASASNSDMVDVDHDDPDVTVRGRRGSLLRHSVVPDDLFAESTSRAKVNQWLRSSISAPDARGQATPIEITPSSRPSTSASSSDSPSHVSPNGLGSSGAAGLSKQNSTSTRTSRTSGLSSFERHSGLGMPSSISTSPPSMNSVQRKRSRSVDIKPGALNVYGPIDGTIAESSVEETFSPIRRLSQAEKMTSGFDQLTSTTIAAAASSATVTPPTPDENTYLYKARSTRSLPIHQPKALPAEPPEQTSLKRSPSSFRRIVNTVTGGGGRRRSHSNGPPSAFNRQKLNSSTSTPGRPSSYHDSITSPASSKSVTGTGTGVGVGPRKPLAPTMHNRGSILEETHAIEDEESRRLSEMAFLS